MLPISHAEADFSDSHRAVMRNDFEAVVFRLHPEIGRVKDALLGAGARRAMLSGSGSSVFGVFDSEGEAELARARAGRRGRVASLPVRHARARRVPRGVRARAPGCSEA